MGSQAEMKKVVLTKTDDETDFTRPLWNTRKHCSI